MEIKNLEILALVNKAKDAGAVKIGIEFSGSGDEGDIDDIICYEDDDYTELDDKVFTIQEDNKLKDYIYTILSNTVGMYGDWINGEGGYGTLYWNIMDNTYNVDYVQRTTEDIGIPSQPMFA